MPFFRSVVVFLGQPQHAYDLISDFYYAYNMLEIIELVVMVMT